MIMEIAFLNPSRFNSIAAEQILDEEPHANVDQPEEIGRGRIERVVEIEDPAIDMAEREQHWPRLAESLALSNVSQDRHNLLMVTFR